MGGLSGTRASTSSNSGSGVPGAPRSRNTPKRSQPHSICRDEQYTSMHATRDVMYEGLAILAPHVAGPGMSSKRTKLSGSWHAEKHAP